MKNEKIDVLFLLKDLLKKQGVKEDTYKKVINYHNELLQNRNKPNVTNYKINYLYWSNILCYGEDNYIDFRNFNNNIVLLKGNNKFGKSSIIDIIIRILFNECYRGHKEHIINKNKKKGKIKIDISIGEDNYIIEQLIYSNNRNKYFKLFKNRQNITKDNINETYLYLKNVIGIGKFHDFVNMTTALQNRKFLVDIEKKELLSLFTKILDIDMLEDIEKNTSAELRYIKKCIKENSI